MSAPSLDIAARHSRWIITTFVVLCPGALWLLDTHQPAAWPEAATAWFHHVRALEPASVVVDRLNAVAMVTPDLPAASALVLIALGVATLLAVQATGVGLPLSIAVAGALVGTRTAWSSVTIGHDAMPLLMVALAVLLHLRGRGRTDVLLVSVLAAGVTPAAVWLMVPALPPAPGRARRRWAIAAGLLIAALATLVVLTRVGWQAVDCLDGASWTGAVPEVLRPGTSADASTWLALRQWTAVLIGDVHLFGLVVAAIGVGVAGARAASLRTATLHASAIVAGAVAAGWLPPALGAALLLPWWAPWFGLGLAALVERAGPRQRGLALATAVAMCATPALRSATVVPGPWVAGTPRTAAAVAASTAERRVAADDAPSMRRLRRAQFVVVPAHGPTIDACLAAGGRVAAFGRTVDVLERLGFDMDAGTVHAPFADVLQDVRDDHLVALALTPAALPWIGPQGLNALGRLGLPREDAHVRVALAIAGRPAHGGAVKTGRQSAALDFRSGDVVGGRQLLQPVSAAADGARAEVDSPPRRLVTSAHGALAVFDRLQETVLHAAAAARPGLPVALTTSSDWRMALATGRRDCLVSDASWMPLHGSTSRLSLPITAANARHPAVAYLGAERPPRVSVTGLTVHPVWPQWTAQVFDRRRASDEARLRARSQQDGTDGMPLPEGRFVARVQVHPLGVWHADRVSVAAGTTPNGWIVHVARRGFRNGTGEVCRMAATGERLFFGQAAVVDDDTPFELAVWAGEGWHAPERQHHEVSQWTAQPAASVGFRLASPRALVLAMDAAPAVTAAGPQQAVVRVNGHVIADDWQGAHRVPIPAALLRAGMNTLTIEVPRVVQPPRDPRALGVLVRQLRLIRPPS